MKIGYTIKSFVVRYGRFLRAMRTICNDTNHFCY